MIQINGETFEVPDVYHSYLATLKEVILRVENLSEFPVNEDMNSRGFTYLGTVSNLCKQPEIEFHQLWASIEKKAYPLCSHIKNDTDGKLFPWA